MAGCSVGRFSSLNKKKELHYQPISLNKRPSPPSQQPMGTPCLSRWVQDVTERLKSVSLSQLFSMERDQNKKRKGGAEKVRDKKIKSQKSDAATCRKLSDMFAGSSSTADRVESRSVDHTEGEAAQSQSDASDAWQPGCSQQAPSTRPAVRNGLGTKPRY